MSDYNFDCPHCGQSLEASEAILGEMVECPCCKKQIEFPKSDSSSLEASLQQGVCPFCGESILANAKQCKSCCEFLDGSKPPSTPTGPLAQKIKDGQFLFVCSYAQAYSIVECAMIETEIKIKERKPEKGILEGVCKDGVNQAGIAVLSTFYLDTGGTQVEVAANLTDVFDTSGICKKKVSQISDRILSLSEAGYSGVPPITGRDTASGIPPPLSLSPQDDLPPSHAGRSSKGKAITGFVLSLAAPFLSVDEPSAGVLFGLFGIIFCVLALLEMSSSTNKEGRGLAIAGLIILFLALCAY